MDTQEHRKVEERRTWHTPQAYILRGAQAGSGARVPGARESTKNRGDIESTGYNITPDPVMPT
jgi:hypothetical protein